MPGPNVHDYIDRQFFGKSYPKIHRAMDRPAKYFGSTHRVLFHDETWACAIAKYYPNDPNAIIAALYHLLYDDLCSKDPNYKKYLEKLAQLSEKKKKKKKPKTVRVKIRI